MTIWGLVGGLRENVATPYLLVTCTLIFGGICWSATQVGSLRDRFTDRYKKLRVIFDRAIPSCRADVTFGDGSHAICFRLQVENESTSKLEQCEAWIESADRFPNISPFRLFWAGDTVVLTSGVPRIIQSMSVDLIKNVPRFVQICRITDKNRVVMATEGELWPIDSINAFHPGKYIFNIALKGKDRAETTFYSIELNWTGNWTTADMRPVTLR